MEYMNRNHSILLSVLTLVMIAATVLFVRASNIQSIAMADEQGISSEILLSDSSFLQTHTEIQTLNDIQTPSAVGQTHYPEGTPTPINENELSIRGTTTQNATPSPTLPVTSPTTNQSEFLPTPINNTPVTTVTTITSSTPTSLPQTGWDGQWTVWFGSPSGGHTTGTLSVTVSGESLSAKADFNGTEFHFEGNFDRSRKEVSGRYTRPAGDGWFFWQMITETRFGGTLDNLQVFCAARSGDLKPEPCGIFVTY